MARLSLRAVPAVALGILISLSVAAQDPPAGPKIKQHADAYDKMKSYLLKNLGNASMMEKVAIGILLMADGRHPTELQTCLGAAKNARAQIKASKWSNWYIGFGSIFLAQYYLRFPSEEIQQELEAFMEAAVKEQEPTGGWFSSTGAAKKAGYPAEDHGQLTAMVYAGLLIMKSKGMKIPSGMLEKTEAYINRQCGGGGITYGTGNGIGDTTGSRGGFALVGLSAAKRTDSKLFSTYRTLYPQAFNRLEKGHHIGGWHFMGCILGCWSLGPDMVGSLRGAVLDKYVAKIDGEGGFYIGDDGASGGEKGLMGHNYCSTASLALLIALQDPNAFKIPNPQAKKPGGGGGTTPTGGSGSPFSQKNMGKPKK
jgi:hypothetical protein